MAAEAFSPAPPGGHARLSISSSSQPSPASSDSTTNTPTFSFQLSYVSDASPTEDVVPKVEELEDDELEDMKVLPLADGSDASPNNVVAKRPRGRPRKHPISPQSAVSKTPKGRSKTGCITCRRRKKKCDETKPICVHCQKNNVHCEGYPPRAYWKSGKQRAEEGSPSPQALALGAAADLYKGRRSNVEIPRELPVLIEGVETDIDRFFLQHFNLNLSKVLTLFTEKRNPFNEVLLPMALRHKGLMHSILCLSGSHLSACEPTNSSWGERQYYHFQCAIENLHTDENMAKSIAGDETAIIDDPTVAQTLVLCLKSICAGEVHGEYRPHMDAARHLIQKQKSRNQEFQSFLIEFFVYHDVSNSLTSLDRHSVLMMEDFKLPEFMIQPESGALLGVVDGLFGYISKIRQLRDRIRTRRKEGLRPLVDYDILSDAQEIDAALRDWVCCQPPDTPRWIASMLYRQCTWLYLHRTILPSVPNPNLGRAVDQGLLYLQHLPPNSSTQSILLMPTFLLGCAAFHAEQRPQIQQAFADLQAYSQNGNITHAKAIVEKVWEMIDGGREEESWDWESIMEKMGLDFLVT